jgi:hypothetical protein
MKKTVRRAATILDTANPRPAPVGYDPGYELQGPEYQ